MEQSTAAGGEFDQTSGVFVFARSGDVVEWWCPASRAAPASGLVAAAMWSIHTRGGPVLSYTCRISIGGIHNDISAQSVCLALVCVFLLLSI